MHIKFKRQGNDMQTSKKIRAAILGCGGRGLLFTSYLKWDERFEVVALCDREKAQIEKIHIRCGLENAQDFLNVAEFFQEKRADFLVIATHDSYHVEQCVKALKLGYDVLLEKPISDKREDLHLLLKTQEETGKKVIICHELRYGVGFVKCGELLKTGAIGELYAIDASERVVYWHWAQAYVRGIGALSKEGSPAILAKCSHDLDILQWYAQSECDTVSSIGGLTFFKKENQPKGASDRCIDCRHIDTCPYSAKRIYVDAWHKNGEPSFVWPYNKLSLQSPTTEEALYKGLQISEYGRCVFACEVEKVDHQFVQMQFQNGVKASLKMVYGAEAGRKLVFYGTYGEMTFDERTGTIEIMPYGGEKQVLDISSLPEYGPAHGGGDGVLMSELYDILTNKKVAITSLKESIECHLIGVAAEESRMRGGECVKVHRE